jgi:Xaa-Pro dipeptidase
MAMAENLIRLPFSPEEYAGRVARVREQMDRRGLDLLLVTIPENAFYLTGFQTGSVHTFMALAVPRDGEATWVIRKTEMSNVRTLAEVSWVKTGHGIDDSEDPVAALADVVRSLAGERGRIGVEQRGYFFTVAHFLQLQAALPEARFEDGSPIIDSLRVVKSPAELGYMRRAGEITAAAIKEGLATVREGMLDNELASALIAAAIRNGSEPMSMGPFVTSGERTFLAHSSWAGIPIRRGELINTEMATVVARYNTPTFRVSVIGPPSAEIQRFHDASRAGLFAGLEGIKPGMTGAEGDTVVRRAIEERGFGEYFVVRAAYGIGLGFPPRWSESHIMQIRQGESRPLQPGMCFHLVPALYKQGFGAVCCSMPIEITSDGCRPLAPLEPELFVL